MTDLHEHDHVDVAVNVAGPVRHVSDSGSKVLDVSAGPDVPFEYPSGGAPMDESEFDEAYADDPEARVVDERRLGEAILGAAIDELEPQPAVSIQAGASVRDAIELMQARGIGAVLVLDDRGRVDGIFTERDVLRRVALSRAELTRPVADLMTPSPECLGLQDGVAFALNRMIVGGFRHVPIVDDAGAPVAVLSLREVVSFIVSLLPSRVLNLPPEPRLEARSADGG